MYILLNRSTQGLLDHVGLGNVSTEHLLEHLKATLQLPQSVATAWSDGATLGCAIAYNFLLHQRDQALRGVTKWMAVPSHCSIWGFVTSNQATFAGHGGQSSTRQCPKQGLSFLLQKKSGGWRPVIDLSFLNFLPEMESAESIRWSLPQAGLGCICNCIWIQTLVYLYLK